MKRRMGIFILAAAIIGLSAAGYLYYSKIRGAFGAGKVHEVKVERVSRKDISASISASGIIEPLNKKDVYIEQPVRLLKLYAQKGDRVNKGDRLADFDLSQLQSQYNELLNTEKMQRNALQKLEMTNPSKSTASLEAAVQQAQKGISVTQSGYNNIKEDYQTASDLYKAGVLPQAQFDKVQDAALQAKAASDNAAKTYYMAKTNLNEAQSANSKLQQVQALDISTQEENIKSIQNKIADLNNLMQKIKDAAISPISGAVSEINASEGAYTSPQYPVMTILDTDNLQIRASVKEFDIRKVSVGQAVLITGDAINESDNVKGKVEFISHVAKRSKTVTGDETAIEVIISLDKKHDFLMPGLSVTCQIVTAYKKDVPVINFTAVKEDKNGNKNVFVVDKNGQLVNRPVKLGISSEMNVEVISGLNAGDLVVVNWQPNFKAKDRVKIVEESR